MNRMIPRRMIRALMVGFALALFAVPFAFSQEAKTSADWGILIKKKDISIKAKFYPYTYNGKNMEIFAVKASDGTIRTALNTCQVCYSSGRGYYKQVNAVFICQNCGNQFRLDQIEKIRGGCNPIPILGKDKTDLGDSIGISKKYLASVAFYFEKWKKN
ncbi:MAG: DUF2318 domain-containing protein [Spirochaetota bacterium]